MHFLPMVLTGAVAGIAAGLFGVGGGIILVPMLVFFFGYPQDTASGTSLVALVLPVGVLGVLEYYRSGRIDGENIKFGLIIAAGLFFGAYFGAKLAVYLPLNILTKLFALLMFFSSIKMFFHEPKARKKNELFHGTIQ